MGFNNGYDSGYSDCEVENRKRWEREAVERYKAENPPSGGGSSGASTEVRTIVATVTPDPSDENSGSVEVDAQDIKLGETVIISVSPSDTVMNPVPATIRIPQGVANVYPRFVQLDYDGSTDPRTISVSNGTIDISGSSLGFVLNYTGTISFALTRTTTADLYIWPIVSTILDI